MNEIFMIKMRFGDLWRFDDLKMVDWNYKIT